MHCVKKVFEYTTLDSHVRMSTPLFFLKGFNIPARSRTPRDVEASPTQQEANKPDEATTKAVTVPKTLEKKNWTENDLLKDTQSLELHKKETRFWQQMIDKYLKPLVQTEAEKKKVWSFSCLHGGVRIFLWLMFPPLRLQLVSLI